MSVSASEHAATRRRKHRKIQVGSVSGNGIDADPRAALRRPGRYRAERRTLRASPSLHVYLQNQLIDLRRRKKNPLEHRISAASPSTLTRRDGGADAPTVHRIKQMSSEESGGAPSFLHLQPQPRSASTRRCCASSQAASSLISVHHASKFKGGGVEQESFWLLFGAPAALFSAAHRSSLGLCSPRGCICSALPR